MKVPNKKKNDRKMISLYYATGQVSFAVKREYIKTYGEEAWKKEMLEAMAVDMAD